MRTFFVLVLAVGLLVIGFDRLPYIPTPAVPASATPVAPDVAFTPSAADRVAGWRVLTVNDLGGPSGGPLRWQIDEVAVRVTGVPVSPMVLAGIDDTLGWLTEVTGVRFFRSDDPWAPVTVTLGPGLVAQFTVHAQAGYPGTITSAQVQWDPAGRGAVRWRWEELLQMAGPMGDHGPPGGSLFTDYGDVEAPTAFDAWLLRTLYTDPTVLLDPATPPEPGDPRTVSPR